MSMIPDGTGGPSGGTLVPPDGSGRNGGTHMARTFDDEFVALARLAHRVAYRITGDATEAEDLAQEALARAALRWRRIEPYAEAWVVRVATNLAIGRWRRDRKSVG